MTGVSPRSLALSLVALAALLLTACTQGPTEELAPIAEPSPTAADASEPTPTPLPSPAPLPEEPPPVEALPLAPLELEPAFPGIEFDRMVLLTHAGDDTGRLFLVLQPGMIVVFENDPGVESAQTFLDIRERVSDAGNEEGLLGLAFDPAYAENGYLYVYYSASRPRRSVVSRFSVSPGDADRADPDSELVFMEVEQPYSNHNGGHIVFGPDGMLYVGLGDGGAAGDPQGNGQDTSTFLGSILRIDVSRLDSLGTYAVPDDNPFAGSVAGRPAERYGPTASETPGGSASTWRQGRSGRPTWARTSTRRLTSSGRASTMAGTSWRGHTASGRLAATQKASRCRSRSTAGTADAP